MQEKPILFSGAEVREVLAGRKTMTRQVIKPQPDSNINAVWLEDWAMWQWATVDSQRPCPYGVPGDRLWVRETWSFEGPRDLDYPLRITYRADKSVQKINPDSVMWKKLDNGRAGWRPSIHMPRWASRLTLKVIQVRAERLHEIGRDGRKAADVLAEGVLPVVIEREKEWFHPDDAPAVAFAHLWDAINGKRPGCAWAANPWVWVITFARE